MEILFKLHAIRGEEAGSNTAQLCCQKKMEMLALLGPRAIGVSQAPGEGQQGPGQHFAIYLGETDKIPVS